ncbi:MAG: TauD/TfdA family dioxygenase [Pseudomonadota bacterium]
MDIKPLGRFVGAEVTGIDLARPLSSDEVEAVRIAHATHGVLVFPGQEISSADLMRVGRRFGELSVHPFSTNASDTPELIVYDNKEGNPPLSTDVWHTDETFRESPPMGTMLVSKIIPELGGDTCFVNMGAVYEGLSPRMQRYLEGLEAIHDFLPFKRLFSGTPDGADKLREFERRHAPSTHPVVRVHPVTGRKLIYVTELFTVRIKDMDPYESRMLLDFLYHRTKTSEYQYRHRWQPNTLVFWDNRLVQHSAVHDYYPQRRLMERVTISGDRPLGDGNPASADDVRRDLMPPIESFVGQRATRQNELDA